MNLRNRVQLIGNLGSEPQIREFENGRKLARFSLATTDVYKKEGKYVRDTQWHSVTAWNRIAEVLQDREVSTGSEIIVIGSVVSTKFTDREGRERKVSEIVADSIMVRHIKRAGSKVEKNIA